MREFPQLSDREIARQLGVGNKTVSRWRSIEDVLRELLAYGYAIDEDVAHPLSQFRRERSSSL
jgi:hypothetical protein